MDQISRTFSPSQAGSDLSVSSDGQHERGHMSSQLNIGASIKQSQYEPTESGSKVRKNPENAAANKGRIEDQMNNENLKMLQQIFEDADEDGGGGLDIEEFGRAMKMAFGQQEELDDKQLAILFMKVDTNCDGTVDWEEFCSYMLLENQQKDSMSRDILDLPFPNPARELTSPHHDSIARITYFPSLGVSHRNASLSDDLDSGNGRYISCSKDGVLVFWGQDLHPQRTIMLGELNFSPNKSKQIWVTDVVCLANVKKVAVSTTEREIAFYDCSAANFEKQFLLCGLNHCVLTMDYWYNPRNLNESCLLFGDAGGGVSCITFNQATVGLFDGNIGKKSDMSTVTFRRIPFPELLCGRHPHVKAQTFSKLHEDWVRKVKYIPNLRCFLSCSNTSNTSLYLGDLQRKKMKSYFKIKKGLYTFDYDKDNNCIITGGMDRYIRLWNPYVTTKATSLLKGHGSAITHLIANGEHQQIISISKDRVVKVWDIRDHCCIQTIPSRNVDIGPNSIASVYYNHKSQTLLLGSNVVAVLEKKCGTESISCDDEPTSHAKPLCAAIYNDLFNQVVSACHGSVVNVWQLDTGEKIIMFSEAHRGVEITAISFDPTKRRLITGARDGSVKIWNFNNGACLRDLRPPDDCEVTGIICPKQRIVAVGWNRNVIVYRDVRNAEDELPKLWCNIHKDDVLSVDLFHPNMIATASYDGQITAWSLDTGHVYSQFNVNNPKDMKGSTETKVLKGAMKSSIKKPNHNNFQLSVNGTIREGVESQSEDDDLVSESDQHRSIDKVLFLQSRENAKDIATLLTTTGGLIQAWSVTGNQLLGQFTAANMDDESVLAMATDKKNSILLSGDTSGYIKVWDIYNYCCGSDKATQKATEISAPKVGFAILKAKSPPQPTGFRKVRDSVFVNDGTDLFTPNDQIKSGDRETSYNSEPPTKLTSYRGHSKSIVTLDYVEDKQLIISASADCCVRLWTITGRYIGTFGQKSNWRSLDNSENLIRLPRKIPADIQRVASANTLKVLCGSTPKWRLAKNILHVLHLGRRPTKAGMKKDGHDSGSDQDEDRFYSRSRIHDISLTEILGKNYTPRKRHKMPPMHVRPKMNYNQCIVYSALPCSDLIPIKETNTPPVVAQIQGTRQQRPSTVALENSKGKQGRTDKFSRQINTKILPLVNLRKN